MSAARTPSSDTDAHSIADLCRKRVTSRSVDGLLDVALLADTRISPRRNAIEATDKEFLAWVSERLQAGNAEARLQFRLTLITVCEELRLSPGARR